MHLMVFSDWELPEDEVSIPSTGNSQMSRGPGLTRMKR